MSDSMPLISLVTIHYNNYELTRAMLLSLNKLTYKSLEIIVVDNASTEDHTAHFHKEFPFAQIVRAKENLGFTGGNNIGMKLAKGDFILLINNDTEIADPNFLQKLLIPFNTDKSVGIVSPKIKYFDDPNIIQYAGFTKINPFTGRNSQIGEGKIDSPQFNNPGYTPYAHGAAMIVKREILTNVGVLTDHFFLCYEELDWSAQAFSKGYNIFYQPETYLLHKESMTIGKASPLKAYYNNRNRIMFMRRNAKHFDFFCFIVFYIIFTIPKNTIVFLLKNQHAHLKAFLKAIGWNLSHINIYNKIPFHTKLSDVSLDNITTHYQGFSESISIVKPSNNN